jgi:hypothetical protein
MGLDMYLRAEQYVSGYEFSSDKALYRTVVDAVGLAGAADPETPSATVSVTVAYWRKANAIHRWFVDNVQNGEDECRPHYVSRDQLVELRDLCARVFQTGKECVTQAASSAVAEEELPPQSGFFFGGTEIDEWYWQSLEDTVKQLDRVLENVPAGVDFEYQSSW